ncbi:MULTISPECIES: helicase HerA-like domain-containing protein [unclassified Sphingomonas]|uniref:helicase HerA-like domain-containing protein n=2 Tax=Sphingomonas TaxID=13687 RepID=UPI0006F774AD|nr:MULTISPECIES: helicase HerA-like domain-containing protein [unclassified Sphingomonas]KQY70973.1 ATP-binding protein [Sphingomonas sp. Root50]KRB92069.1 ATP-binding protein [Sphingomonas sp. Root720]
MIDEQGIFLGASPSPSGLLAQHLNLRRANRHGLIAGATGTGKTVTLQGIAENFSAAGVPVFLADVKGDLSGIAMAGSPTAKNADKLVARAAEIGLENFVWGDNPTIFWDLYGEQGHPIRTTVSEVGPLLLARLMNLNEVQEGVLNIAFRYADEEGLLLLDLGDLQAMLAFCAENADDLSSRYGNVTRASVGSIQRQLLQLDSQGGAHFFGEPALDIHDFLGLDDQGRGYVNVLAADKLMQSPKLYATFLLWLLSELFENLPEVGDPDKPRLVFFFDEAHLLFDDAPKALTDKIEQVVRLIRSKGVGVYFVTQNPIDVPEDVAAQLGNRIQHALRAFTPRDQKAIEAAADTFRINPDLDVARAIIELKVGEALVSVLQEDGSPSIVQRTLIAPPRSRLGSVDAKERAIIQSISPVAGKYDDAVDRESAEEILAVRGQASAAAAQAAKAQAEADKAAAVQAKVEAKAQEQALKEQARRDAIAAREAARPTGLDRAIQSATRAAASSVGRQVANEVGRAVFGGSSRKRSGGIAGQLVRGILGGLFK